MLLTHFIKTILKESLASIVVGLAAFALILAMTLDFKVSILALLLIIAITIFQKSFSRGWLFLFSILILIPSTKIGSGAVTVHDMLLAILALVGLVQFASGESKIAANKLYFFFFLLVLTGASMGIFGKFFSFNINPDLILLTVLMALIFTTLITFQHFFQTKKRIKRFIFLVISIGVAHSLFGIFSFIFGWQSSTGMGITPGTIQLFSDQLSQHQINGFLGNGYVLRVGENALSPLLLIAIPLTLGLILNTKKKSSKKQSLANFSSLRFFDSIHTPAQREYWIQLLGIKKNSTALDKLKSIYNKKLFLIILFMLQVFALILTFSYSSILIFGLGLFVIAVLLRKKGLISVVMVGIITMTLILPATETPITLQPQQNISQWFSGIKQIQENFLWGSGWNIGKEAMHGSSMIYNSYLFVWNTFGLIGLLVLVGMLFQYFKDLRKSYISSDGQERIWLVIIIAIFFEFILLAITNNSLFFGPSAIIFWLLYGVGINLRKKTVVFGLTETRLHL